MANNNVRLQKLIAKDAEFATERKNLTKAISKGEIAPIEAQIEFLNQLVNDQKKAEEFLADPVTFVEKHSMSFSLDVVQSVTAYIMYDGAMKAALRKQIGEKTYKTLVEIKETCRRSVVGTPGTTMNALAVVAAVAAVVGAAASVVCAVTALKGFRVTQYTRQGVARITMPDGKIFVAKDLGPRMDALVAANASVLAGKR